MNDLLKILGEMWTFVPTRGSTYECPRGQWFAFCDIEGQLQVRIVSYFEGKEFAVGYYKYGGFVSEKVFETLQEAMEYGESLL